VEPAANAIQPDRAVRGGAVHCGGIGGNLRCGHPGSRQRAAGAIRRRVTRCATRRQKTGSKARRFVGQTYRQRVNGEKVYLRAGSKACAAPRAAHEKPVGPASHIAANSPSVMVLPRFVRDTWVAASFVEKSQSGTAHIEGSVKAACYHCVSFIWLLGVR
jgi:hypothetical protein